MHKIASTKRKSAWNSHSLMEPEREGMGNAITAAEVSWKTCWENHFPHLTGKRNVVYSSFFFQHKLNEQFPGSFDLLISCGVKG